MRLTFPVRILFQGFLVLSLSLVITELYFRWMPTKDASQDFLRSNMAKAHDNFVEARIDKHWANKEKIGNTLFFPPHIVYLNEDIANPKRLREIAKHTKFPPSQSWTTANFLRSEADASSSSFAVSTNALGFRGSDHPLEKSKSVFRILVFGTYPAFGHGVSNEFTYAHKLENYLQEKQKRKIEVWNLGRQGTTAISGLALLETEALNYKPDLILWDFGWVDLFAKSEHDESGTSTHRLFSPIRDFYSFACGHSVALISKSQVCKRLNRNILNIITERQLQGWKNVYAQMIQIAKQHHIPVVLVRHNPVQVPLKEYEKFKDENQNIYVLDTSAFVDDTQVTDKMIQEFWATSPTWVDEIGVSQQDVGREADTILRGDAIFYNKNGYDLIAKGISEFIEKTIFPVLLSTNHQASDAPNLRDVPDHKNEPHSILE